MCFLLSFSFTNSFFAVRKATNEENVNSQEDHFSKTFQLTTNYEKLYKIL